MNILFYLDPVVERDCPNLKSEWVRYAGRLSSILMKSREDIEVTVVLNKAFLTMAADTLQGCHLIFIDQVEFNANSTTEQNEIKSVAKSENDEGQARDIERLLASKLNGIGFDFCITFSNAPFLQILLPETFLVHLSPGFIFNKPFPRTIILDSFGIGPESYIARQSKEILAFEACNQNIGLVKSIRAAYTQLMAEYNPLLHLLKPRLEQFCRVVYLPLQSPITQTTGLDSISSSPLLQLEQILTIVDDNTAVIISEDPNYLFLDNETITYLEQKYCNFVWHPLIRKVTNAAQYLIPLCDVVSGGTEATLLLSLLWEKEVHVHPTHHLAFLSTGLSLPELLDKVHYTEDRRQYIDGFLAWYFTCYQTPEEILFRSVFLLNRLIALKTEEGTLKHGFLKGNNESISNDLAACYTHFRFPSDGSDVLAMAPQEGMLSQLQLEISRLSKAYKSILSNYGNVQRQLDNRIVQQQLLKGELKHLRDADISATAEIKRLLQYFEQIDVETMENLFALPGEIGSGQSALVEFIETATKSLSERQDELFETQKRIDESAHDALVQQLIGMKTNLRDEICKLFDLQLRQQDEIKELKDGFVKERFSWVESEQEYQQKIVSLEKSNISKSNEITKLNALLSNKQQELKVARDAVDRKNGLNRRLTVTKENLLQQLDDLKKSKAAALVKREVSSKELMVRNKHLSETVLKSRANKMIISGLQLSVTSRIDKLLARSARQKLKRKLLSTSFFDFEWYCREYDLDFATKTKAVEHYVTEGMGHMYKPNFLFCSTWYLKEYQDVFNSELHPVWHYLFHGEKEGRNPGPLFDTGWFVSKYQNQLGEGESVLDYYLSNSKSIKLDPNPFFNASGYCQRFPEVEEFNVEPFEHYLKIGFARGLSPHPLINLSYVSQNLSENESHEFKTFVEFIELCKETTISVSRLFDSDYYISNAGLSVASTYAALKHFTISGYLSGVNPHPLFHCQWYGAKYLSGKALNIDFLTHYIIEGDKKGCKPNPFFDPHWYRSNYHYHPREYETALDSYLNHGYQNKHWPNPVFDPVFYLKQLNQPQQAQLEPLSHYVTSGKAAGLKPSLLFDSGWYLEVYKDVAQANIDPMYHYIEFGITEERQPHWLFFPTWYLDKYPDVRDSGILAVYHFMRFGLKERNPCELFNTQWYANKYAELLNENESAIEHFITHSRLENVDPCAKFSSAYYRQKYMAGSFEEAPLFNYLKKQFKSPDAERLFPLSEIQPITSETQIATQQHVKQVKLPGEVKQLEGTKEFQQGRKSILLVAHTLGKNIFGAERSFLDMVKGASDAGYNVFLVFPNDKNKEYLNIVKRYVTRCFIMNYGWWTKNKKINQKQVAMFKQVIEQNDIDLVHVNTIMLREPLVAGRECGVPTATHVRELISFDKALCDHIGLSGDQIIAQLQKDSDYLITNSKATYDDFNKPDATFLVYNTVDTSDFKDIQREADDTFRVAMISSNIPKKGIYDFVDLAKAFSNAGISGIEFCLIGPLNPQVEKILLEKESGKIPANLVYGGYFADVKELFPTVDLVVNLSHFKESFGRTICEAMAASKPVIGYNWGALPELIEHEKTGYLVEYRNSEQLYQRVLELFESPEKCRAFGQAGLERCFEMFDIKAFTKKLGKIYKQILVPKVETSFYWKRPSFPGNVQVSVIVPNYNYEKFLPERLNSIINQTTKPVEIIFLDDCSTDDSVNVAREILESSGIDYQVHANQDNCGVFKQWRKGIQLSRGDYIWIAEADDVAELDFLETLVTRIEQEQSTIAYAQSRVIDENGAVVRERNLHHTDAISKDRWKKDFSEIGIREVVDVLSLRNTIPNASACLFEKRALINNLSVVDNFKYCGDWVLYCALLKNGTVSYCSEPLNHFRRHTQSVTRSKRQGTDYLQEILRVHQYVIENFPINGERYAKMLKFLDSDYKFEGVTKNSEAEVTLQCRQDASRLVSNRQRILIVTTNNGSHNGGSEVLWVESAKRLRELGHDVVVIIKNWQPAPAFFGEFWKLGIKVFFKESLDFSQVIASGIDLAVLSTGCQDEGREWFEYFERFKLPYVIVNQLTKEPGVWPVKEAKNNISRAGYCGAKKVYFTCKNNRKVMEGRLNCELRNADYHFNPTHIERDLEIPYPNQNDGVRVAVPARLLTIHKAQDNIIKVLGLKKWKERPLIINFYGDGPDKGKLEELAQKLNVVNIEFIPRVDDVKDIWKDNHAILLASKMEGLPIVLVGAMMCSRAGIVTDIGGNAEIVQDNVNGFVAANTSIEALDEALERAWQRRDELQKLGKMAKQRALEFVPEKPVDDFIEKLLSNLV